MPIRKGFCQFQFSTRKLLEATFWIAAGLAAFIGLHSETSAVDAGPAGHWVTDNVKNTVFILLLFFPGAAFGAAVGVFFGNRFRFAYVGFFIWTVLMFLA
jgi:hypothetical protein